MKFQCQDFNYELRTKFTRAYKVLCLFGNIAVFMLIAVIFSPIHLLSYGFMRKITTPILNVHYRIADYLISKICFILYCEIP